MVSLQTPCPICGERTLRIEMGWHTRPIAWFSLSGHQMKFSAQPWPFLVCDSCGLRVAVKAFIPTIQFDGNRNRKRKLKFG